jgi:uncharacterized phage-associated protein
MRFSFSHRKSTQALNFFAQKAGGSINKLKALKLVYFADRYHLRKYGRPITSDEYLAMPFGPVASGAKDLAEMSDFLSEDERTYVQRFLRRSDSDLHAYESLGSVDERVLSASDREALAFSWSTFGSMDKYRLADLTHCYPEWKRHEAALASSTTSRVRMDYEDFLGDPDAGCDPCHDLTELEREDRLDLLRESAAFESRWR